MLDNSRSVCTCSSHCLYFYTYRAKSFDSFDFSTLYTNIPHEALKTNIRNLIREAFKIRGSKYLIVSKDGKAHWSLEPSLWSACVSVDNSKLVEWTNYLIDNVYIKVGFKVYRQTVGIPMEGSPVLPCTIPCHPWMTENVELIWYPWTIHGYQYILVYPPCQSICGCQSYSGIPGPSMVTSIYWSTPLSEYPWMP